MSLEEIKVLLNRIPALLIVLAFGIWEGWTYYQFVQGDPMSPLAQKEKKYKETESQTAGLRRRVKEVQEFMAGLDRKREELRTLAIRLGEMKSTLSEELDVPAIIKFVITEAKRMRVTVRGLRPESERLEELYVQQPFRLEFQAIYAQLVAFLVHVTNAQNILKIGALEILPNGSQESKFVPIKGTIELLAFRYSGTEADRVATSAEKGEPSQPVPGKPPGRPIQPPPGGRR